MRLREWLPPSHRLPVMFAGVILVPAIALPTELNKGLGLPYGKVAPVLQQAFGLEVTRGGLCQAIARAGRKSEPTHQRLIEQLQASVRVTPDETGWRVGGNLRWLWGDRWNRGHS